jgi:hypothetical protein
LQGGEVAGEGALPGAVHLEDDLFFDGGGEAKLDVAGGLGEEVVEEKFAAVTEGDGLLLLRGEGGGGEGEEMAALHGGIMRRTS